MKDTEFLSAKEKELVLKSWRLFIKSILNGDLEKTEVDRYGNRMPVAFKFFTDRVYKHLSLHCSFIAHYSRAGFFDTYFTNPEDTLRILTQFGEDPFTSIEYGSSYWREGDYSDINTEMCRVVTPLFSKLSSEFVSRKRENDLSEAASIAQRYGMELQPSRKE